MEQDFETFMGLERAQLAERIRAQGFPRLGVYIPDGTRRLTLAMSDCPASGSAFFQAALELSERYLYQQLMRFFESGLWGMVVPLFSQRVLSRSEAYAREFALPALEKLTCSPAWLDFYHTHGLQVHFYGVQNLQGDAFWDAPRAWMAALQEVTQHHTAGVLCLGVGGSPVLGEDALAVAGCPDLDVCSQRLYGVALPRADFVIMTGKMGGLGALPPFICDGETALYLMPAPGFLLSESGWRAILYDLLYQRHAEEIYPLNADERRALGVVYQQGADVILGLGERHYGLWMARELYATVKTRSDLGEGDQT